MVINANAHSDYTRVIFFILTVLLTFNTLLVPFDKLLLPAYIALLLSTDKWFINKNLLFVTTFALSYIVLIFFINCLQSAPLIIYPVLFAFTACLASRNRYITPRLISSAILVNILAGVILLVAHYVGFRTDYVGSLVEKGIPFIQSPIGFSPTTQVYGTLCILWLIIAFETRGCYFGIFIVSLALLITLNRVSLMFLFLILFFYRRKLFYFISIVAGFLIVVYFDFFVAPLFNTGTLSSRVELRRGAEISYWQSDDLMVWIFGRANHQTSGEIAARTVWEREYIENGLDFILHSYGAVGLLLYFLAIFAFLTFLIKRRQHKYAIFVAYYTVVLQFLTNEFLSSSLFFFVLTILMLSDKDNYEKSGLVTKY